jgi:nicotinamidase-related amidase
MTAYPVTIKVINNIAQQLSQQRFERMFIIHLKFGTKI